MTPARYTGQYPVTYVDYVDAATGHALSAVPGGTYDVAPAPGRSPGLSPLPADGRWQALAPADPIPQEIAALQSEIAELQAEEAAQDTPQAAAEPPHATWSGLAGAPRISTGPAPQAAPRESER